MNFAFCRRWVIPLTFKNLRMSMILHAGSLCHMLSFEVQTAELMFSMHLTDDYKVHIISKY